MSNSLPGFFLTLLEGREQVNIVDDVIIILLIFGYLQSANSSLKLLIRSLQMSYTRWAAISQRTADSEQVLLKCPVSTAKETSVLGLALSVFFEPKYPT